MFGQMTTDQQTFDQQTFDQQTFDQYNRYVLNLLLVKNHKIAKNSTTTKGREKIRIDLESLEF
jgi:hypothetical protein